MTKPWDKEAHYAKKSLRQLTDELQVFRDGQERDAFQSSRYAADFYANHIEYLRMKIAERIGK